MAAIGVYGRGSEGWSEVSVPFSLVGTLVHERSGANFFSYSCVTLFSLVIHEWHLCIRFLTKCGVEMTFPLYGGL